MFITILTMILVVMVLIGFNALYVAGEFAAVSVRRTRIIQRAEDGNRLAKMLLPIIEDPAKLDNYIAASQVGITVSSIMLGIYGEQQISPLIAPLLAKLPIGFGEAGETAAAAGTAAVLVLIVLTTLQVIMGELLPKTIAIQYPEELALGTAIPMRWSADYILKPLIVILNGSGVALLKLLGMEHKGEHAHMHSPEEIIILVKESHQGGLIDSDERLLLKNMFRVRNLTAEEIAIPRTWMVVAEVRTPVNEVLELATKSAYTRIPIYEDDIDHIIGFVHLRDLFYLHHTQSGDDLRSILREMPFLPETLPALEVWERLNETESYIAVVFDEFGQTAGLISREDMIEELFGELQDEFDQERALISVPGKGRLVVRGDMQISYLNDLLDVELPHETFNSVGGMFFEKLGRVPVSGDEVTVDEINFRVEGVTERTVTAVSIRLPPGIETPSSEEIDV